MSLTFALRKRHACLNMRIIIFLDGFGKVVALVVIIFVLLVVYYVLYNLQHSRKAACFDGDIGLMSCHMKGS